MKYPKVFGLVLCAELDFVSRPGVASLVGVFHALRFHSFPTARQRFTVYTALYGGSGEGTMELTICQLETERDIHRWRRWFKCPGRGQVVNYEMVLRSCIFPSAGKYAFTLKFDGHELATRLLTIYRGGEDHEEL